jgi:hypothetical protein
MSIEILLDILLSAVVLYIYHSDCAEKSTVLEYAVVGCTPEAYAYNFDYGFDPDFDYDFGVIPSVPVDPEWELEKPIMGPVPDELIASIGSSLGVVSVTVKPTIAPTVKQLRTAAKLLGVKNASRLSKAELITKVANAMGEASITELPIGDGILDLSMDGLSIT